MPICKPLGNFLGYIFFVFLQPYHQVEKVRASGGRGSHGNKLQGSMVPKIKEALNLIRNHFFEMPYIANYRREYIEPELDIHDLWRIFHWDEKVGGRGTPAI